MVTKQELDNVLQQMNAILQRLDSRITEHENSTTKQKTTEKRATTAKAS